MHEYGIVGALVAQVEREAQARGATSVHRVEVAIGELAGVDVQLLVSAYEVFRAGSVCAKAELSVRRVDARWQCPRCAQGLARAARLRCPRCDAPGRLVAGDDLVLERIELEVSHV